MLLALILVIFSALALAFAFPVSLSLYQGVISFPYLSFVAPILLFIALSRLTLARTAFLLGAIAGFIFHYTTLYWIADSYGQFPLIIMSFYLSLWFGTLCVLINILLKGKQGGLHFFLVPGIWASMEFLRSFGASGFPWLNIAHSLYRNEPILQLASLGGEFIVSFYIILASYTLYFLLFAEERFSKKLKPSLVSILLLLTSYGWGWFNYLSYTKSEEGFEKLSAIGVQGGISSRTDWQEKEYFEKTLSAYVGTSISALNSEGKAKLIVWPESAVPHSYFLENPEIPLWLYPIWQNERQVSLLNGTFLMDSDGKIYNGALLIEEGGKSLKYYLKPRLVPYGEFVPLARIARFLEYPWGDKDITASKKVEPINLNGAKIGVGVCFDNLFPQVFLKQVREGARVIFLLTNNSWNEMPASVYQHLALDSFRAVENRRTVFRVATTGISQVTLPSGRVTLQTPLNVKTFFHYDLPISESMSLYLFVGDSLSFTIVILSAVGFSIVAIRGVSEELF